MAEEKKTVKKAAGTKPASSKAASAPAKKSADKKSAAGTVTVKQTGSPARSEDWAYQTLIGLGLNKMNRVRTLEDTPAVRGMIARVHHLVTIQDAA